MLWWERISEYWVLMFEIWRTLWFLKQEGQVPSFFHHENCEVFYQSQRHANTADIVLICKRLPNLTSKRNPEDTILTFHMWKEQDKAVEFCSCFHCNIYCPFSWSSDKWAMTGQVNAEMSWWYLSICWAQKLLSIIYCKKNWKKPPKSSPLNTERLCPGKTTKQSKNAILWVLLMT